MDVGGRLCVDEALLNSESIVTVYMGDLTISQTAAIGDSTLL